MGSLHIAAVPNYDALVLEIGNVFCMYSGSRVSSLPASQIASALASPAWYDYERGKLSKQACYERLAKDFDFALESWTSAIEQLMATIRQNEELIAAVRELRSTYPSLRVFGMTNMAQPVHVDMLPLMRGWCIFDEIYSSASLGFRKPDLDAFEHFVRLSNTDPQACVFIDDTLENVIAAEAFGFRAIHFKETGSTVAALHNLLGDPIKRGRSWLQRNAQNMFSETTLGEIQKDNYAQLLILQCTGNKDLVVLKKHGPVWNYYIEPPKSAGKGYPFDSDTTALAMIVLDDVPQEEKEVAFGMILANLSPDGLPLCWFDPCRPRICHCIAANVFRFFYLNGRGDELRDAYTFFCRLLKSRAYLRGSRYYQSPDWLLFILGDLCARRPRDEELKEMRRLVHAEMSDRMGCDTDVLSAALRLVASQKLGMPNTWDLRTVLGAQQADGGWEKVLLWGYGTKSVKMGGRGVITALAVLGVQLARNLEMQGRYDCHWEVESK
ncbi:Alpha-D-glucose-1-phosphate phosphatase YihX [Escovopsis weberi]|uniref:Alpha-D-glucose-1-phosphate phosphatase YihX n=1 Tax=Escovopsis weberi TaxID=150374 RepID=A0A0M8N725_ESCWE|nr:Alpha-D-glucose-1-phosphate phosphatase YihX [Escovopsis weberi]